MTDIEKGIIRHLKKQAEERQFEDFVNWFVITMIFKDGNRETGMNIHKLLKCKNSLDVIYKKLHSIQLSILI